MLTYAKLARKGDKVSRFTGLSQTQFALLAARLQPLWERAELKRLSRPDRKRVIGAGRPYKLATIEDKLLLILMFYRLYINYDLLEVLFDSENSQIYRLMAKLEPLVERAADPYFDGLLRRVNHNSQRIRTIKEFIAKYPDLKDIILDATEQKRQKPKGDKRQRRYYSGKKKQHTLKTGLVINPAGRILAVTGTVGGRTHDQKLFRADDSYRQLPEKANKYGDLGFEGMLKDGIPKARLPVKKRRLGGKTLKLTRQEKEFNRKHARIRVKVEHAIARLKKYNILAQTYRSAECRYNRIFRNVAALVNFRLDHYSAYT